MYYNGKESFCNLFSEFFDPTYNKHYQFWYLYLYDIITTITNIKNLFITVGGNIHKCRNSRNIHMLRLLHEQSTTTASNTIKYVVQHWNFGLKTLKSQQMLIVHIIVQKGILFNLVGKASFFLISNSQTSNF